MRQGFERRSFLQGLGAVFAVTPELLAQSAPSGTGVRIAQGHDRFDQGPRTGISQFQMKVSGKDTGKQLLIYEFNFTRKGGPPVHIHHNEDEWLYVVQGNYVAQVGGERKALKAGDAWLLPRGIPHTYAYTGEAGTTGKNIVLFQPAGLMEEFFHLMASDLRAATDPTIMPKYGLQFVAPPLAI